MKIAIIYTTKGGTTRECAELLARELAGHEVSVFDMDEPHVISEYDTVVIGFPIRMARPVKKARRYIKENSAALLESRVAYYMCCGFIDCADEYAEKALKRDLGEKALTVTCLGGSLDPSKFKNVFDKIIIRMVRSEILGGGENGEHREDMSLPTILDENIAQLADLIKTSKE